MAGTERLQKMAGKECRRLMSRVAMAGKKREQKMTETSTGGMVQSQGGIKG